MEPTTGSPTGKIVTALIIGLVLGFAAGAFWQERRLNNLVPKDEASALSGEKKTSGKKQASNSAAQAGAVIKSGVKGAEGATTTKKSEGAAGATVNVGAGVTVGIGGGASGPDSVEVSNQPAGSTVRVAKVTADGPVWVAVRDVTSGGLGRILGAQKAAAGETADVTVDLLRATKAGSKYAVVLYQDLGSPAFDYHEDILIAGAQGQFTAQ